MRKKLNPHTTKDEKKLTETVMWMRRYVRKFGPRCLDFARHCIVCDAYRALDELSSFWFHIEPPKRAKT